MSTPPNKATVTAGDGGDGGGGGDDGDKGSNGGGGKKAAATEAPKAATKVANSSSPVTGGLRSLISITGGRNMWPTLPTRAPIVMVRARLV